MNTRETITALQECIDKGHIYNNTFKVSVDHILTFSGHRTLCYANYTCKKCGYEKVESLGGKKRRSAITLSQHRKESR